MPSRVKHQKTKKSKTKTKKHLKPKKKATFRGKRTRNMRGGSNDWKSCPNAQLSCNWFDKHYTANGKVNETWDTCIDMNGIKNHIARTWDPRMRNAIISYNKEDGSKLSDLVKSAITKLN